MAVSHATRKVSPNTYIHAQKTAHEGCFCVSRVYTFKNLANFTSKRHTFYMSMQIYNKRAR